jgi:hypothetical protein
VTTTCETCGGLGVVVDYSTAPARNGNPSIFNCPKSCPPPAQEAWQNASFAVRVTPAPHPSAPPGTERDTLWKILRHVEAAHSALTTRYELFDQNDIKAGINECAEALALARLALARHVLASRASGGRSPR